MSSADRTSPERTELEVRWNQRSFWRNTVLLVPVFLGYIAIAVFASGTFRLIGVAGASCLASRGCMAGARADGKSGEGPWRRP